MINEAQQKAANVVVVACMHAQSLSHVQLFVAPWTKPTRLPCAWNFPVKNTGVDCHFLLQGTFWTQRSNPYLLHPRHWQMNSLPLSHLGSPLMLRHPQTEVGQELSQEVGTARSESRPSTREAPQILKGRGHD